MFRELRDEDRPCVVLVATDGPDSIDVLDAWPYTEGRDPQEPITLGGQLVETDGEHFLEFPSGDRRWWIPLASSITVSCHGSAESLASSQLDQLPHAAGYEYRIGSDPPQVKEVFCLYRE